MVLTEGRVAIVALSDSRQSRKTRRQMVGTHVDFERGIGAASRICGRVFLGIGVCILHLGRGGHV